MASPGWPGWLVMNNYGRRDQMMQASDREFKVRYAFQQMTRGNQTRRRTLLGGERGIPSSPTPHHATILTIPTTPPLP